MKSSTYACLATLVFVQYKNHISKSIESVIRTTDAMAQTLNFQNNLSHMTKYRIICDLLNAGVLVTRKTAKCKKLKLSRNILKLIE